MQTTQTRHQNTTCGCCGTQTIPPYTDADGYTYEGYYCEECGAAYTDPSKHTQEDCLIHRH